MKQLKNSIFYEIDILYYGYKLNMYSYSVYICCYKKHVAEQIRNIVQS